MTYLSVLNIKNMQYNKRMGLTAISKKRWVDYFQATKLHCLIGFTIIRHYFDTFASSGQF